MTQDTTSPVRLFSYGTLQDTAVQLANFGRALNGTPDAMLGYTQSWVAITDPAVLAASGKTHHPIVRPGPDPAEEIPGMVFELTADELAAADRYEVSDYRRVSVQLKSGRTAWVYVSA
ncbi:gamma-glutamylcyclotransferase family protein [Burkholderia alba]|uniref:gamma-glutamylcyclotransferase family protein n=1 Tax=Burkholderia alba TaxID=2683677 RepID=UPI002B053390|nr:gamma-glutamylcyclotransferase family protein [Burkholderia alba]